MLRPQFSRPGKRGPGLFDATLGALTGAATGGIFGLFSIGICPAIANQDVTYLITLPLLSLMACLICAPLGWFLGWLIGPRLGRRFNSPQVEIAAGVVAGLLPAGVIVLAVVLFF